MPRSDGLIWECPQDFQADGTHPSPAGSAKVANLVLDFLKQDPVAQPWLLGGGSPVDAFCFGDGSGTPCPCFNSGAPGSGCRNSGFVSGCRLSSDGTPSVSDDDLRLRAAGMPSGATVLFFQGFQASNGGLGIPFGDGLRCVGGGVIRLATLNVSEGMARYPGPGDASISSVGMLPPMGGARNYQAWYRDPAPGFCTPATFNFSNALHVVWAH